MQNRRDFIKSASVFSAMMASAPTILRAQGAARTFKVAMIGSGRRATAAFGNMMDAAKKKIGRASCRERV